MNDNNSSQAGAVADPERALLLDQLLQSSLTCIDQRDYERALQAGRQMLELEPAHVAGRHVVGLSLLRLGDAAQALPLLEQTATARPRNGLAHWQRGQALLACGQPLRAIEAFDLAEALGVTDPLLEQQRQDAAIGAMSQPCNWENTARLEQVLRQSVASGGRWVVGEYALASPVFDFALLRQAAAAHARQLLASLGPLPPFASQPCSGRIRLGFVGGDFFAQATAYLMVGFIEALDRRHFQVFAYDHGGHQPDSALRQRVLAAYDHVVDIAALSDEKAAAHIHGDGIDILFSITSPARARLGLLARRPAPVQVHYLYYPGTSGMPFFDFIVADEFIIPPGAEAGYSEKVLRLPGCYQPNDSHRSRARDTTRAHWGLPEDAVVMANFSQSFKLTPTIFGLWCELLRRDGRRLLWLLGESAHEQDWLRGQARDRGVAPERICFSNKLPSQAHLDRLRQADLVLDTFPYGGHTLTSDALWAGTPVVTLCGETFASRVAASLLHELGMGELVAYTEQAYLDQAERLLKDPQQRQFWRRHLDAGRDSFTLFDAQAYARKFEAMVRSVVS